MASRRLFFLQMTSLRKADEGLARGAGPFAPPAAEQIAFLRAIDSPTIANAIEQLQLRDRCEGYVGGSVRCMFPDLGVMVGHALTVTMDSCPGSVAGREGHYRMWEALLALPRPSVIVVKDLTGAPTRCAYFGEVMASIATACGAVGVVSDGGVRDLAEVHAMGLHYFAPCPVVSHGNFRIVDVGVPVTLDGQRIETGDLLHGDANGIVIVPSDSLSQLPEAVERIRQRERKILDYARKPGFTLDGLRETGGY
jgi:4-hydroxy-4-methyl-2-oxoglutarate aldolase